MKKFLSLAIVVLAFSAIASSASAQSITKWTLRVYNVGAAAPLSAPTDLLAANVVCGIDPATVPPATSNPTRVVFEDPSNATKVCVWTDPGSGPLASSPFGGSYEGTLTVTNSAGTSAESAPRAPFSHPGVIAPVPTGVRFGK